MEWIPTFGFCLLISIVIVLFDSDPSSRMVGKVMLIVSLAGFGVAIYGNSIGAF